MYSFKIRVRLITLRRCQLGSSTENWAERNGQVVSPRRHGENESQRLEVKWTLNRRKDATEAGKRVGGSECRRR